MNSCATLASARLASGDKEIPQEQPHTAIQFGIVGIREGRRGQIPIDGRVVRPQPSVVSPADEWAGECVQSA